MFENSFNIAGVTYNSDEVNNTINKDLVNAINMAKKTNKAPKLSR